MQSYLAAAYRLTPFPKLWAQHLASLMAPGRVNEGADLASGAGGPLAIVTNELRILELEVNIILTDLLPNPGRNRLGGGRPIPFRDWPEPVDARQVPASLKGIYTMFGSFHHFRRDDAYSILRNAFDRRLPICVFDITSQMAAPSAILIPILFLVLTPMIRSFSWLQILLTYLIPTLPILIFWDHLVSHLRPYSVAELRSLTHDLQSPDYAWHIGVIKPQGAPFGAPYLIGRPTAGQ